MSDFISSDELPVNASIFDVDHVEEVSGTSIAILRCRGSYAYFQATSDPSGFERVDFSNGRVFMTASRLATLREGDVLQATFEDGEAMFCKLAA